MQDYDVVIVGGSIAGSVAGYLLVEKGLKTLIVESAKTPREKPCSGIQFSYFEKLINKKIPKEKLCSNNLNKLYMEFPNKKSFKISFKMLNFCRDVFDSWLNSIAVDRGAVFRDRVRCSGFERNNDNFIVSLHPKHGEIERVKTTYLIAADGLMSKFHRELHPEHFSQKPLAPTMNYYIKAHKEGELDPNTLYQFWNLDFSNTMFAWAYKKNDLWVIGAGNTKNFIKKCDELLNYIKEKFNFEGEIIKREGFAATIRLDDPKHVFLGEGNLLLIGDAAGLVDMYRGLGMDAAALSAHHAAWAILKAIKSGIPAIKYYEKRMHKIVTKIERNIPKTLLNIDSNDELMNKLRKGMLKTGLGTFIANAFNKLLPASKQILLPL